MLATRTVIAMVLTAGCFLLPTPVLAKNKTAAVDEHLNQLHPGSFSVEYQPSQKFTEIAKMIEAQRRLQNWVKYLTATYSLANDIKIIFKDCGQPNAFYDPDKRQIELCYEIINEMLVLMGKQYDDANKAKRAAGNALTFIFLHEVGHALSHAYGFQVNGLAAEVKADELATYILLSRPIREGKIYVAANGAQYFALLGNRSSKGTPGDREMADEHLPDKMRYFQIVCWIYGSAPTPANKAVVVGKDIGMPEERANRCPGEYEQMKATWDEALRLHRPSDD